MTSTAQAGPDGASQDYMAIVAAWTPQERAEKEKKLMRKIDFRLLPILIVMYIMNYVDRNALPQARVQGLEKDLGLEGVQYNIVLSVTFIGYILLQTPSNMLLSLCRPSWYLAICMVAWGAVSACTAATFNFAGIAACRFFLGATEVSLEPFADAFAALRVTDVTAGPFFAGVAFVFSGWYTRKELGLRLGIFFCAAMFSGAFGGLFAAGIAAAFQHNAIASWRWLFIIEGAATVVFAVVTAFVIPDWPATTKWLTEEEKALGVVRIIEDAGQEESEISNKTALKLASVDFRVWLCILGQFCLQAVASLTNFLPTLVAQFGFNPINTLLLTAPPYIFTGLFCLYNTWHSDRTGKRSAHIIYPTLVCIAGIVITLATLNQAARYFALFLMLPGSYGCFQVSNAWMANVAARPKKKRAVGLAMNNAIGNLALVWTPYLYQSTDGPRYTTAWSVNLALCVVLLVSTVFLSWCLKRDNRKMDEAAGAAWPAGNGVEGKSSVATHCEDGSPLAAAPAKYDT